MNLLADLQERLAQRRVIVVAGAGVSIAASGGAGAASWKGLLESGIEHCVGFAGKLPERWAERMRESLATDDVVEWVSVATQMQERLRGVASGEFRRWLEDTIGKLTVTDPGVLEALRDLQVPIATTNYDNLLEGVTGWPEVTWRDPGRIQRVLQGDEEAVIHLHGHYKDPESVVLGYRSYADVLGDRAAQALQQMLRGTLSALYVGFGASFQDPNFSAWLAWARETFQGRETYRHYRLCREDEREAVAAEHRGEDRIFALSYGERHEDLGAFLRGLGQPEAAKAEAEKPASPVLGLPAADWLFGRRDLLVGLVDHLCSEDPAPVPILGGPGMGKTALSVHAFRHPAVEARYGPRRYFTRCEAVTSAEALPGAIASAMSLQITGAPREAVRRALASAPALLVLDNLETPWDLDRPGVEVLLSELAAVPGLALVASVRGSLRPQGVRWHRTFEVGRLEPFAAEKLFHEISGGAHRGDPDLDQLLGILDGVPIAVRLMAHAAADQASLRWVLDTWRKKRTAMLRRAEGKDDDLEVSIALSIEGPRLDGHGRQLMSWLGLLPSGLSFEDLDHLDPDHGHAAAGQLVGAGLASYIAERIQMLAPIREAALRLTPADLRGAEHVAHHFLELVRFLGPKLGYEEGQDVALRLEPEIGNLEALFRRALRWPDPSAAFAATSGLAKLMRFLGIGSPLVFQDGARVAHSMKRTADQANCVINHGHIALARSDHDGARDCYEEALSLFGQVRDERRQADCIQCLGDIALDRSDYDAARARYESAIPLYQNVGSVLGEANCIKSLGNVALARSDYDYARARYEEALPHFRHVGDVLGEANCILSLGDIALERSDHDAARGQHEEALPLYQRVGDVLGEANCIRSLGEIALRRSDHGAARGRYEEALPLFRQVGSVLGEANCIQGLGDIADGAGDTAEALGRWRAALELYLRIPEPYSIGHTHRRLARAATDEVERARHIEAAREAWRSIDRPDLIEQLEDLTDGLPIAAGRRSPT